MYYVLWRLSHFKDHPSVFCTQQNTLYIMSCMHPIRSHHSSPVMVALTSLQQQHHLESPWWSTDLTPLSHPQSTDPPALIDFHSPEQFLRCKSRARLWQLRPARVACGDRLEWTDTQSRQWLASKQQQMSKWSLQTLSFIRQATALLTDFPLMTEKYM